MKKLIINIFLTCCILCMLVDISSGISSQYLGIKGANFLKIGLSPRAEGMGGSYVSYGEADLNAINYNPAGLTGIKFTTLQFSTLDWIDNVSINHLAFATPSETLAGVLSSSVTFLYVSPVIHYNDWGENIGTMPFYNIALTAGYAKSFSRIQTGVNIKFLYQKIADNNNSGLAFDIGGIYKFSPFSINLINKFRLIMRDLNFGIALKNVGSKAGADDLPTSLEFGYSFRVIKNLHFALTMVKPVYYWESFTDSDYKVNLGMEYLFQKFFFIRTGYKANYDIPNNFSMGFGIQTKFSKGLIMVDYSYAAYTYLEKTNRLSITLKLKDLFFWRKTKTVKKEKSENNEK